jgi:hypothetical protein
MKHLPVKGQTFSYNCKLGLHIARGWCVAQMNELGWVGGRSCHSKVFPHFKRLTFFLVKYLCQQHIIMGCCNVLCLICQYTSVAAKHGQQFACLQVK